MTLAEYVRRAMTIKSAAVEAACVVIAHRIGADSMPLRAVREERDDGWAFGGHTTITVDGSPVWRCCLMCLRSAIASTSGRKLSRLQVLRPTDSFPVFPGDVAKSAA